MYVVICKSDKPFPIAPSPDCVAQPAGGPETETWPDGPQLGEYYSSIWQNCWGSYPNGLPNVVPCRESENFNWGVVVAGYNPSRILFHSLPLGFTFHAR